MFPWGLNKVTYVKGIAPVNKKKEHSTNTILITLFLCYSLFDLYSVCMLIMMPLEFFFLHSSALSHMKHGLSKKHLGPVIVPGYPLIAGLLSFFR